MEFLIDGTSYHVNVITDSFKEKAVIVTGVNETLSIASTDIPDILGTKISHEWAIEPDWDYPEDYDNLYNVLIQPVLYHTITVPFNQTTLTYRARIRSAERILSKQWANGWNQYKGLVVKFNATAPQIEAE